MTAYSISATRSHLQREWANIITHGLGLALSVLGTVSLVTHTTLYHSLRRSFAAWVFALTLMLLYAASTLYHAVPQGSAKRRLRVLDHCAIYLLIAGSYTPFMLVALQGRLGWTLLAAIWGLAGFGLAFKLTMSIRVRYVSTLTYIGMGWLALTAIVPLDRVLQPVTFFWLVAGGVAYTAGAFFYHSRQMRYAHAVFHLFVVVGSACHFVAVSTLLLSAAAG